MNEEHQRQYQKEQAGESPHACKLEDGGTRTRLVAATMRASVLCASYGHV